MTKRKSELKLFFSTPIWIDKINNYLDVNNKLFKYIKNIEIKNPKGINKSNIDGWHSPNFVLEDKVPRYFINNINENINEVLIDMGWDLTKQTIKISSMWSIINKTDATNARHIHNNNYISAAYYVKAPKNCGNIFFNDPRTAPNYFHPKISTPNHLNTNEVSITPEEGLLVLFPSYIQHSVGKNKSNDERIVISFNLNII